MGEAVNEGGAEEWAGEAGFDVVPVFEYSSRGLSFSQVEKMRERRQRRVDRPVSDEFLTEERRKREEEGGSLISPP